MQLVVLPPVPSPGWSAQPLKGRQPLAERQAIARPQPSSQPAAVERRRAVGKPRWQPRWSSRQRQQREQAAAAAASAGEPASGAGRRNRCFLEPSSGARLKSVCARVLVCKN